MENWPIIKTTEQYVSSLPFFKRLWFRFKFWRAPITIGCDFGSNDGDCIVIAKWVDGRMFVIRETIKPTPPSEKEEA